MNREVKHLNFKVGRKPTKVENKYKYLEIPSINVVFDNWYIKMFNTLKAFFGVTFVGYFP